MIKNQRDPDLFKTFKMIESIQYKREYDEFSKSDPLFVTRTQETDYENSIKVEKFETAEENLSKEPGDSIIQRFIRSKGRNRELDENKSNRDKYINYIPENKQNAKIVEVNDPYGNNNQDPEIIQMNLLEDDSYTIISQIHPHNTNENIISNHNKTNIITDVKKRSFTRPSILRLEYKTRYNSSKKHNMGYVLINKKKMEPMIRPKKKETIERYSQFCVVNTNNPELFDIYIMCGDALKPYEFYANEIISIVQKMFKILLKTIVIDFIRDERGKIYFLGVKAFVPYKSKEEVEKELRVGDQLRDDKNLKKFYKTLTCKLCLLSYPKAEITKLITYKLLIQLKNNLAKRGKKTFSHITNHNINRDYSTMCNVCDLCYTLLITEQELMEVNKNFYLIDSKINRYMQQYSN